MIRLAYDDFDSSNASECPGVATYDSLKVMLRDLNIVYTRELTTEIDKTQTSFYAVQPEHFDLAFGYNCKSFIEYVKPTTLQKFQDPEDGLHLLIFFLWEGYDLRHYNFITVKFINSLVSTYRIPREKILFSYGNINLHKTLTYFEQKLDIPKENIIGLNIFEYIAYEDTEHINFKLPKFNKNKAKHFIFKNGVARTHRIYLAGALQNKKLLDNMYFSWLNHTKLDYFEHDGMILEGTFSLYNNSMLNHEYYSSFIDILKHEPHLIDITQDQAKDRENQIKNTRELYEDSYASIVTETVPDEFNTEILFFSEKTYQAIYNFHPFILISGYNALDYLRNQGYATFPELFNEDYDKIPNCSDRLAAAILEIEKFCRRDTSDIDRIFQSEYFQDKLIHNWKNFVSEGGKKEVRVFFDWLESKNK